MQYVAFRLTPGQDLKIELNNYLKINQVEAACIVTCVGSLQQAAIRFANQPEASILQGKFEITSLVGTLSMHGSHVHITIADSEGKAMGGHLMAGNLVFTTAEIVIGILPDLKFTRELDQQTGYQELIIYNKS